jgi:hypothetical protein
LPTRVTASAKLADKAASSEPTSASELLSSDSSGAAFF